MSVQKWKTSDCWGTKEFILLLLLEFIVVIGGIKYVVKPIYVATFQNELWAGTLVGLTIAIVLLLGVYFIALRPLKLSWSEVGVRRFSIQDWKLIFLYSLFLFIGALVLTIAISLLGSTWENSKTQSLQQNVTLLTVSVAFISAAIISPIYEEIFYRGFLYRWLRVRIGMKGAMLISSFIFTIVHIPTYNAMPLNFLSGLIFAWAYEKTNSIWPAVLIHGITNGVMVLLTSFA